MYGACLLRKDQHMNRPIDEKAKAVGVMCLHLIIITEKHVYVCVCVCLIWFFGQLCNNNL